MRRPGGVEAPTLAPVTEFPGDLDRLRATARDGLYLAVGFGVLGYQRLRIAQRAITERLDPDDDPSPPSPEGADHQPWLDLRED